jgi:hypothetical protein
LCGPEQAAPAGKENKRKVRGEFTQTQSPPTRRIKTGKKQKEQSFVFTASIAPSTPEAYPQSPEDCLA